jgi:hypothetical protein
MQLSRPATVTVVVAVLAAAPGVWAQDGSIDVEFLFNYYDQDGDHSPVTGGIGTERLRVLTPVIVLSWRVDENWTLSLDTGVDDISSASIGNIQMELSSATIPASNTRRFGTARVGRVFGPQTWGVSVGSGWEYDYRSTSYGLDWSVSWNQQSTSLAAAVRRFDDAIKLVGIDGRGGQGDGILPTEGWGDRTTTDAIVSLSQTLGRRTAGSIELFYSAAKGWLSMPYHEVILEPSLPFYPDGKRVAERLPDSRDRHAVGVRVNHAFRDGVVQRAAYRWYDDDWGVSSHTIELETHFRVRAAREMWVYPIVRFHEQNGSHWFGLPRTFTEEDAFYTADRDLSTMRLGKYGIGWTMVNPPGSTGLLGASRLELRGAYYDRDDGLSAFSTSLALGWTLP